MPWFSGSSYLLGERSAPGHLEKNSTPCASGATENSMIQGGRKTFLKLELKVDLVAFKSIRKLIYCENNG